MATVAAVQSSQASQGLPVAVDATLTGPTWETLAPKLHKDATGLPVTTVQYILNQGVRRRRHHRRADNEGRSWPQSE